MEQVDVVYNKCVMCGQQENNHCCNVCDLKGMSHLEYYDHTFTKEHDKKMTERFMKTLYCSKCEVQFETLKGLEKHKQTKMHINGRMTKEDLYCKK